MEMEMELEIEIGRERDGCARMVWFMLCHNGPLSPVGVLGGFGGCGRGWGLAWDLRFGSCEKPSQSKPPLLFSGRAGGREVLGGFRRLSKHVGHGTTQDILDTERSSGGQSTTVARIVTDIAPSRLLVFWRCYSQSRMPKVTTVMQMAPVRCPIPVTVGTLEIASSENANSHAD